MSQVTNHMKIATRRAPSSHNGSTLTFGYHKLHKCFATNALTSWPSTPYVLKEPSKRTKQPSQIGKYKRKKIKGSKMVKGIEPIKTLVCTCRTWQPFDSSKVGSREESANIGLSLWIYFDVIWTLNHDIQHVRVAH